MESTKNINHVALHVIEQNFIPRIVRMILTDYKSTVLAGGFCVPLLHSGIKEGNDVDVFVTNESEFREIVSVLSAKHSNKVNLSQKTAFAHTYSVDDGGYYKLQIIPRFENVNYIDVLATFDIYQAMVGVIWNSTHLVKAYNARALSRSLVLNKDAIVNHKWTLSRLVKYVQKGFYPGAAFEEYYEYLVAYVSINGVPKLIDGYGTPEETNEATTTTEEPVF